MNIVIIGSGNVATVLGKYFLNAGHSILKVFCRNEVNAYNLAKQLNTDADINFNYAIDGVDLVLIAVSDSALTGLHNHTELKNHFIVHTAGSVPSEILAPYSQNYGVFYPLQRLNKNAEHTVELPIMVTASDGNGLEKLISLANSITPKVQVSDDEQRLLAHIAAVFTCNFPNHLYALMYKWCKQKNVDFNLLLPLISETANGLENKNPADLQTGPAKRFDMITIMRHQDMLEAYDKNLLEIYNLLTESIQNLHK